MCRSLSDQLRAELGVRFEVESSDRLGVGLGHEVRVELGVEFVVVVKLGLGDTLGLR